MRSYYEMKTYNFSIGILLLVICAAVIEGSQCPAVDGEYAVHIPHESDCSKFYKCANGNPILHNCQEGLHFNAELEVCDWPQTAGCEPGTGTTTQSTGDCEDGTTTCPGGTTPTVTEGTTLPDDEGWVGECPEENGDEVVHLPHESDCTKFYKCNWGKPILQQCTDGLHFNAILQLCDWPEDAGCESGNGGGSSSTPTTPDEDCDGDDCETEETTTEGETEDNTTEGGTENNSTEGGNPAVECPEENEDEVVHLPHESDCTKFYKCDWGKPVLHDCPGGLHFNPALQVCDWPEDAGCESGNGGGSSSTPTTTDEDCDGDDCETEETTTEGETEDNTTEGENENNSTEGGNPAVECPEENEDEVVHLPHESDCTKFYKCDWGKPVLHDCPGGLHFNSVLQVCDWPEDAGCESGNGGGSSSTPTTTDEDCDGDDCETEETTTEGETEDNTTEGETENNSTEGGNPAVECPEENGDEVVHLPHESDCTKFYKCDWGKPVLHDCPGGLHFNSDLQVCDWPEDAGCESGNGGGSSSTPTTTDEGCDGDDCETEETTTEGETEDNTTEGETENNSTEGGNPAVECPEENGDEVVHLPHESDCTKFYKCDWGKPVLHDCPGGLHFNSDLQVCDWPEDAGCESGNGGGSSSTPTTTDEDCDGDDCETEETTTEGETEDNTTEGENENNSTEGGNPAVECPEKNGDEVVHLPHESDCTKFYKCDWGKPVLHDCPGGLHFNSVLQVCDWPEDAGCESGNGGGSSSTPTTTDEDCDGDDCETEETTTEGETEDNTTEGETENNSTEGGNPAVECPEENGDEVVHLPHESDCTKFYKCDWGKPVLHDCPGGLHFNSDLQVCDWPEDAGCESGNGGGSSSTPTTTDEGCDGDDCETEETTTEGETEDNTTEGETENNSTEGGNPAVECPEENGDEVVHLPHESDCTKFYKCDWGKPVLHDCPGGLHFNSVLQVCDWPEDAGCESGNGGGSSSTPTTPDEDCDGDDCETEETTTEGETEDNTTEGENENNSTEGGNPAVECPEENGDEVVHLPHESDCTKFYKCDWGKPVLHDCPGGLHFNSVLQVCDWPEDAGCESGNGGGSSSTPTTTDEDCDGDDCETEEATTEGETEDNTTEGENENNSTEGGNPAVECPEKNGDEVVHLPHESDCTKFYKCDWGKPVLHDCPGGLHFNSVLQVCDWPEDAGCESGNGGGSSSTPTTTDEDCDGDDCETEEPTTDGETEDNTTEGENENNSTEGGNPVGDCPEENGDEAVHLPHESDCTKFYKCNWGKPVLQECPGGLHFNLEAQVCDWPETAGCESGNGGGSSSTPTTPDEDCDGDDCETEEPTTDGETEDNTTEGENENNSTEGGNPVGECPEGNGDEAVHLSHESDCTKFYKCNWGKPVLQECPSGLHFNLDAQVCDWPETAGCESENGGEDGGSSTPTSTDEIATDDGRGFCDIAGCPPVNGKQVYFLPYPNDCTRFCKCNWGTPYEFICPPGLHFNVELEVCDFPEDSGCLLA